MATKKKTEKPEPKTSKKEKKEAPKKSKKKVIEIEEDDEEEVVDLDELVRARKKRKDDTFKGNGHLNHCSCTGCGEPEGYVYAYGDDDDEDEDDDECCEDGDPVIVVFNKSENSLHGPFKEDELDEWLEEQEGNDDEIFIMTILNTARLTKEWAREEVDTEELF